MMKRAGVEGIAAMARETAMRTLVSPRAQCSRPGERWRRSRAGSARRPRPRDPAHLAESQFGERFVFEAYDLAPFEAVADGSLKNDQGACVPEPRGEPARRPASMADRSGRPCGSSADRGEESHFAVRGDDRVPAGELVVDRDQCGDRPQWFERRSFRDKGVQRLSLAVRAFAAGNATSDYDPGSLRKEAKRETRIM